MTAHAPCLPALASSEQSIAHSSHLDSRRLQVLIAEPAQPTLNMSEPAAVQQLEPIHEAVNAAWVKHTNALLLRSCEKMLPTLLQACSDLAREADYPVTAALRFASLEKVAQKLLKEHNFAPPPGADNPAMQRELVQAVCNQALENGNITSAALRRLLQALSLEQLTQLRPNAQKIFQQTPCLFHKTLQQAEQQWGKSTEHRLNQAMKALNAQPTGNALAQQFIRFETAWHALRSYCETNGQHLDSRLEQKCAKTLQKFTKAVRHKQLDWNALDDRVLHDLSLCAQRLKLEKISPHIAKRIQGRKNAADLPYQNAMREFAKALVNNDLCAVLGRLANAAKLRDQSALAHQQLGATLGSAGQNMDFREKHMLAAVRQWDPATQQSAYLALQQQSALIATLEQLGNEVVSGAMDTQDANAQLGRQLLDSHIDLLLLRDILAKQLGKKDHAASESHAKDYDLTELDAQAIAAIRQKFGIALHLQHKPLQFIVHEGTASASLQKMFLDQLLSPRLMDPVPTTNAPIAQHVASTFWNDLISHIHGTPVKQAPLTRDMSAEQRPSLSPRASVSATPSALRLSSIFSEKPASTNYQLRSANGRLLPLVNPQALAQAKTAAEKTKLLQTSIQKLGKFLDSPDLLLQVTTLISDQLPASLRHCLDSSDSPVRLPDGRRGRLTGGESTLSYVIEHAAQQAVTVQFQLQTRAATHFLPWGLKDFAQSVDPENSYFSALGTLRIDKDMGLTILLPMQFHFNATPMIHNAKDLVVSSNAALQEEFALFTKKRAISENWNYLVAYQQYLKQPTAAHVDALIQRFISDPLGEQINVSAQLLKGLLNAQTLHQFKQFGEQLIKDIIDDKNLNQFNQLLTDATSEVRIMLNPIVKEFLTTRAPS